jgi:hypothetical protein
MRLMRPQASSSAHLVLVVTFETALECAGHALQSGLDLWCMHGCHREWCCDINPAQVILYLHCLCRGLIVWVAPNPPNRLMRLILETKRKCFIYIAPSHTLHTIQHEQTQL